MDEEKILTCVIEILRLYENIQGVETLSVLRAEHYTGSYLFVKGCDG